MKNKIIKTITCTLIIAMCFSVFSLSASAQTNNKMDISDRDLLIVNVLKNNNRSSIDVEKRLMSALEDIEPDVTYDEVSKTPIEEYSVEIDEYTIVTFFSDTTFTISRLEIEATISSATTINYTNTVKRYGPIGNTLYTITVKGYWTGTQGTVAAPVLLDAYYTRGTGSMWQVSNWNKGTQKTSTQAIIYGRGNFHYGIEIKGVGFVIQEKYEDVRLWMDKAWKVYGSN